MNVRLIADQLAPKGYQALFGLYKYTRQSGLDHQLLDLVDLRASQLNGCAYCTDMHWKDLRAAGVSEEKLALLSVWREAPGFSDRERAALEWCEAVTLLADTHVPDDAYRIAREQFSEAELVNLTLAVSTINVWNRLAVAFRKPAGTYQPGSLPK